MTKKIIVTLFSIAVFCLFMILPVSAEIDYSCYIGNWKCQQPANWTSISPVQLDIISCTDDTMDFHFLYYQFDINVKDAHIDGNKVYGSYHEIWGYPDHIEFDNYEVKGDIILTLEPYGISVDWIAYENGQGPSYHYHDEDSRLNLIKEDFVYREYTVDNKIKVLVNGENLVSDQSPIILNDRVMLPFRAICEALNTDVYYDRPPNNTCIHAIRDLSCVAISCEDDFDWYISKCVLGYHTPVKTEHMDIQPIIFNDRILVPVRVISETFGAVVDWDENTNTVSITGDIDGNRKSDTEVQRIQRFDYEKALSAVSNNYHVLQPDLIPFFDKQGKYFRFLIDDGSKYIRAYDNGTFVEEQILTYYDLVLKGIQESKLIGLDTYMNSENVIKLLDKPDMVGEEQLWAATGLLYQDWQWLSKGVKLTMAREHNYDEQSVALIEIKSPCTLKTKHGLGIGSTKEEILSEYGDYIAEPQYCNDETILFGSIYGGVMFSFSDDLVVKISEGAFAE